MYFIINLLLSYLTLLSITKCTIHPSLKHPSDSTTTTHYKSYHFNVHNPSQWIASNNNNHTNPQQTLLCTANITSLCIYTIANKPILHILYNHVSFDFQNDANWNKIILPHTQTQLPYPSNNIIATHTQIQSDSNSTRRRLRSRCPNILYQRRGRVRPRRNKRIARINIQDNMIISLDVTINRRPRSTWGNILHCGSRNTIRQPGLWINRNKYLHVVYGTTRNWNKLKNYHIRLGRKYKIMWKIRRNRYDVYVNGRRWFSVRGRHHNKRNQPCYLSDPWHEAMNGYVENLKIIKGTDPSGGCRRRGRCNERLRGRKDNGYRGCQTRTVGGYTCQKWTRQSPHRHGNTPRNRRGKGLGNHNYCRNPDGERTIWCYTTSRRKRWDYCKPKKRKRRKRKKKRRKRRRKRKKRRNKRRAKRLKRRYERKLYRLGKKIGKVLNKGNKIGCKQKCNPGFQNNLGGFITGYPAPKGYGGMSQSFVSGMTTGMRRRTIAMNGYDHDNDNDNEISMMETIKKCVFVGTDLNEICVTYFYSDGNIELEYNEIVSISMDKIGLNSKRYHDGKMYMEQYQWIWYENENESDNDMKCNDNLLSFIGYNVCIENENGQMYVLIIEEDMESMEESVVEKINIMNENEWNDVYVINGAGNNKKMCVDMDMIELCIEMRFDGKEMEIISQRVLYDNVLENENEHMVNIL